MKSWATPYKSPKLFFKEKLLVQKNWIEFKVPSVCRKGNKMVERLNTKALYNIYTEGPLAR